MGAQQRFEQGFPRREMTKQCSQTDTGPAGKIAHRDVGAVLGGDVSRDRENVAAIFLGVGSHGLP